MSPECYLGNRLRAMAELVAVILWGLSLFAGAPVLAAAPVGPAAAAANRERPQNSTGTRTAAARRRCLRLHLRNMGCCSTPENGAPFLARAAALPAR